MLILAWTLLVLFSLAGIVGVFLPAFPGIILIFFGVFLHKLLLPGLLSWWTVAIVAIGFAFTYVIDFLGSAAGAKWGGASKWGMAGLFVGGFVGLFFGFPGIILGPLLGVFLAELLIAAKTLPQSARAGVGATLGLAVATLLKFLLALGLVAWTVIDLCIS